MRDDKRNRDELMQLINTNIGDNIARRRKIQHLTRHDLSQKVGGSVESIRQYELGNNNISAARLFIISLALDMPIQDFFNIGNVLPLIETEQDKILNITKDFLKISSPLLAASLTSLIQALTADRKSLKEDA